MFERFTESITIVRMIEQGDLGRLQKVISAGAKLDRRTACNPWMTPLDAAASSQNAQATAMLLAAGAPIYGSSIYDAISKDAVQILRAFHRCDSKFHERFRSEANNRLNPRLNRWLSIFTALDFATSVEATNCAAYLFELGARSHSTTKPHRQGCTAILISEESFIALGGVNVDGLAEVTTGLYCAKCQDFVP